MKVKDENGNILSSENPVIIGMWKKAGYTEVGGNELPKDGEPLTNDESQDEEPKKGRKKAQE